MVIGSSADGAAWPGQCKAMSRLESRTVRVGGGVVGGRRGGECGRAASARDVRDEVENMVRLAAYQTWLGPGAGRALRLMTQELSQASHSQHPRKPPSTSSIYPATTSEFRHLDGDLLDQRRHLVIEEKAASHQFFVGATPCTIASAGQPRVVTILATKRTTLSGCVDP